ncbi:hypothetical protein Meth11DRAFT_0974 [Methylophilaceae bacterium 11]|nr:hypothetical protein Meth11DRAFT_0974 [Methylophilaceae bacterium 11]
MARKVQSKPEQVVETTEPTQAATVEIESPAPLIQEALPSACGGALRAAREKQKLSVQDIASQLRLGVNQVEALEADRYDKLPQPSIVRGFIRNYAKALKIDAAPIVAAYSALVPDISPQSFAVKPPEHRSVIGEHRASFSFKSFIGLLLCFALIAGLFYYYTQVIKPNVVSEIAISAAKPSAESTPAAPVDGSVEFALPAAERQDNTTPIELPAPAADANSSNNLTLPPATELATQQAPQAANTTAIPTTNNASTSNNAATAAANALQPKPNVTTATPPPIEPTPPKEPVQNTAKSAQLVIDATEETWVNIVDASGKQIYSKVLAAGTSDSVNIAPPLSITVGNAHGTSISMNGQALDLLAHTRDRVARIKVN